MVLPFSLFYCSFREKHLQNNNLSKRQNAAIYFVIENGYISIQDYENLCPETNKRTLQRELKELTEIEILYSEGSTI